MEFHKILILRMSICVIYYIIYINIYNYINYLLDLQYHLQKAINDRSPRVREKGKNEVAKRLFLSFRAWFVGVDDVTHFFPSEYWSSWVVIHGNENNIHRAVSIQGCPTRQVH